jgi:hypothetical protein
MTSLRICATQAQESPTGKCRKSENLHNLKKTRKFVVRVKFWRQPNYNGATITFIGVQIANLSAASSILLRFGLST